MAVATCRGCSNTWTGQNFCHCPTCHETFSTEKNFDRHRIRGICKVKGRGLEKSDRGIWRAAQ